MPKDQNISRSTINVNEREKILKEIGKPPLLPLNPSEEESRIVTRGEFQKKIYSGLFKFKIKE